MFNEFHEKRFVKWEVKKRGELGNRNFLIKYSAKLPERVKIFKILLPLNIILCTILALLYLFRYKTTLNTSDSTYAIVWFCCAITWAINYEAYCTHRFVFWIKKAEEYKTELENLM